MRAPSLVERARAAFAADVRVRPPLSLRGGYDVDSYQRPAPFDETKDEITDEYLEQHAFWGLGYLDAQSWRHYLPNLIAYALRHPDDPHMVAEALLRSLRPPDRYPPRLATLTPDQEAVIVEFLHHVAISPEWTDLQDEAHHALEEWWLPNPRSRPTNEEIAALRSAPISYRSIERAIYSLAVPVTLSGSGVRSIPEESREVEVWAGYLCGDAHTAIAVNVTPIDKRTFEDTIALRSGLFREVVSPNAIAVPGASDARRMDGFIDGDSPAEPQALTVVVAIAGGTVVTLTIRTWPREDLAREIEQIVDSLTLVG